MEDGHLQLRSCPCIVPYQALTCHSLHRSSRLRCHPCPRCHEVSAERVGVRAPPTPESELANVSRLQTKAGDNAMTYMTVERPLLRG